MAGRGNPNWSKGRSGNPGGRPRLPEGVREQTQALTPAAIETLAEIMSDRKQSAAARVSAANAILDRAYGKPGQSLDLNKDNGQELSHISDEALIAALLLHQQRSLS